MAAIPRERWSRLSPYLDEVLTLSEQERSAWLAALQQQDPRIVEDLNQILRKHHEVITSEFLDEQAIPISDQGGRTGLTVGAYTLISPIGQGGMSTVWLAERNDGRFQRKVAVKFLSIALYGRGEERFRREGSILGRLTHPHIAQLLDAGISASGEPFLVLEHVDGMHIDKYCDSHRLNVVERCRLLLDVIGAVAHAHAHLIVHRDVKPSNVLVTDAGQVKLLDFGIAKLLENEGRDPALTREGNSALTPQYAAPEQLNNGQVTTATDVYALGVLVYKVLSGAHPSGSKIHSHADLVKSIVDEEPAPLSSSISRSQSDEIAANRRMTPDKLQRALRGDLDTIVAKSLKKDPGERYASVTALGDDLCRYLEHEPVIARPDTIAYRTTKFVRRNLTAVVLSTFIVCAVVIGIVGILVQMQRVREQRDFAFREASRANAVTDLQDYVLSDAGPHGKPFTLNELLGRAEQFVTRDTGEDDANRVELLISIGRHYWSADEDAASLRVLQRAFEISRGLKDPALRAKAACALAPTLARNGEPNRAEDLVREGLREIPDQRSYVQYRSFCLLRGQEVADHNGAAQLGIDRILQARNVLSGSPFNSRYQQMTTEMMLAEAYREAGRLPAAISSFERAFALMTALGHDDTDSAIVLLNNWALALEFSGNPLEAEEKFARSIQLSQNEQLQNAASPTMLANYAHVLKELARTKEAEDYALRSLKAATELGDQETMNQVHLELARIYRQEALLARSNAMLDEVEPRLRHDLPPGHYAFAAFESERALNAEAAGNLPQASGLAKHAMEILNAAIQSGKQGSHYMPILLGRQSVLELQMHQPELAAADAAQELSFAQKEADPGQLSANIGRSYLHLGMALLEQRKAEEARTAFRSALQHLVKTLGPDHPDTVTAGKLARGESINTSSFVH